jgi:hypothetical protein
MSKQKYPQKESVSSTASGTGSSSRKKTNGYSSNFLHAKRDWKRKHAEERQADYKALTIEARIAQATGRRGESKRELARLAVLLANRPVIEKKPKKVKAEA